MKYLKYFENKIQADVKLPIDEFKQLVYNNTKKDALKEYVEKLADSGTMDELLDVVCGDVSEYFEMSIAVGNQYVYMLEQYLKEYEPISTKLQEEDSGPFLTYFKKFPLIEDTSDNNYIFGLFDNNVYNLDLLVKRMIRQFEDNSDINTLVSDNFEVQYVLKDFTKVTVPVMLKFIKEDPANYIIFKSEDATNPFIYDDFLEALESNIEQGLRRGADLLWYGKRVNESYTNDAVNIGDIYDESDVYSYCQELHRNEEDFWDGDLGERIERYSRYKVMEVSVDEIDMDEYFLDEDYMNDYIKKYEELGTYPPIVLTHYYGGSYGIIDGTHRANALKEAGLDKIIAFVGLK